MLIFRLQVLLAGRNDRAGVEVVPVDVEGLDGRSRRGRDHTRLRHIQHGRQNALRSPDRVFLRPGLRNEPRKRPEEESPDRVLGHFPGCPHNGEALLHRHGVPFLRRDRFRDVGPVERLLRHRLVRIPRVILLASVEHHLQEHHHRTEDEGPAQLAVVPALGRKPVSPGSVAPKGSQGASASRAGRARGAAKHLAESTSGFGEHAPFLVDDIQERAQERRDARPGLDAPVVARHLPVDRAFPSLVGALDD